jgi:hypothetical protein
MDAGTRLATSLAPILSRHLLQFMVPCGDRFESCWQLYALSEQLLDRQKDDPASTYENGDILIWGTGTRAIKTFRGSLYLAGLGHGPQAVMLCRSLIEDALTAKWADENRDEALRLIGLHERHTQHLYAQRFASRKLDLGELAKLPPLRAAELQEMTATFNRFGTKGWTGHQGLHALYKDVRNSWGPANEIDLLDHVVEVDLAWANQTVHNTAMSLRRPKVTGNIELYDSGESSEDVAASLLLAFWGFAHAIKLMLRAPYRPEFEAFYYERMPSFFRP